MPAAATAKQRPETRRDLVLLLVAAFGCVLAMTIGLVAKGGAGLDEIMPARLMIGVVVVAGALLATAVVWRVSTAMREAAAAARAEIKGLKRRLATAEAIVKAEPQVLIYWERGEAAKVVAHALPGVPGIPETPSALLAYGQWLEPHCAQVFKVALDDLFEHGQAFNLILRTCANGYLEADGRAAGGRAVLRLRDVAGYRRDLGRIQDAHQMLARDIRASRAVLDALPNPVWIKDQEGRLAWVNSAYVAAVEAGSASEVIERRVELLETRQRQVLERTLAESRSYRGRLPLVIRGNRGMHDVIAIATGQAVAAIALDASAADAVKAALGDQSTAYDRTLDRVGTAVAVFSSQQRLTYCNEAYVRLWQLDPEWLGTAPTDGEVLDRLKDLGRLPEIAKYREWKARQLEPYSTRQERAEELWHLAGGRVVRVMPVMRPDGGITYLYEDETERLALKRSVNSLTRVQSETLDSLKEGVAVFGTDGRLKLSNTALSRIWKLRSETLAKGPHIEQFINSVARLFDDRKVWGRISLAVTAFSHERKPIDGQMVRPDNSVIDFAATPLPDGATLITFVDVTDAKRYERALVERNEALVTADRLKNRFIGHVSYELRTPLTNIIGFSEMLSEPVIGELNEKQREYLGDITASSKTLLAIIDDILDLTTIDAGALELKLGPVKVREVIEAAVHGIDERARLAHLTLDIGVADDAQEFVADDQRVRQVLYNLLSNAVSFSHTGGTIWLAAWRENGRMIFAVQDQGVGIPKENQGRVFERFESRSQGVSHRGAGLGLSIVKSLVDLHGGTVDLESEPGYGTRVTVSFPERGVQQKRFGAVA